MFNSTKSAWRTSGLLSVFSLGLGLLLAGCGGGGGDDGSDGDGEGGTGGTTAVGGATNLPAGGKGGSGGNASPTACAPKDGAVGEMVAIPAGEFLMGCDPSVDASCDPEEQPQRPITLKAFEIDKTEVTQDQYAACVAAGACAAPQCDWNCEAATLPASCVTWQDAKDFCAWANKRLPTEAEWEKAARGGDGRLYPWGNDAPTCALANKEGCGGAAPVGSLAAGASPFGVLDMAGSMVEMVADYWSETYYGTGPATDPTGPSSGDKYVGRGGGFKSPDKWIRVAERDWYDLEDQGASLGFRCAK